MKISTIVLLFTFIVSSMIAQSIRPVCDDTGFCWKDADMDTLIKYLDISQNQISSLSNGKLYAGISPHDDFLYAGKEYYPLFNAIRTKEVVILGLTHGTVRKEIGDPKNILILDEYTFWKGPYKNVSISPLREYIKQHLNNKYFITSNKAHSLEHSIEALIPFLQYYNRDIRITPIMVTAMSFNVMEETSSQLANVISEYIRKNNLELGKDIFFLISSDANHYGMDFNNTPFGIDEKAHTKGTENDKKIASECLAGKITLDKIKMLTKELWPDSTSDSFKPLWCGRYSIPFGLLTISALIKNVSGKDISGQILKYSDTWTEKVLTVKNTGLGITAPFSLKHWVGFFSAAFFIN
jgi:MEMO1 family protein